MNRIAALLVLAALATAWTATGVAEANSASQPPRLGTPQHRLPGFGRVRPAEISFGGDPTSDVAEIHWTGWGSPEAVGTGKSDWVWPGTCVACNPQVNVRVIAFHLGSCHGHRSYNAFEWYFPQYGEVFKPGDYTNPCTHRRVEKQPPPANVRCADAALAGGATASEVIVEGLTCAAADNVVAGLPAGPFEHEQRFEVGGFRCGTEGSFGPEPPVTNIVECRRGAETVTYTAKY